eukprot:scaffold2959_cov388-Prasinococcus_capsulatus_cf.AAC.3
MSITSILDVIRIPPRELNFAVTINKCPPEGRWRYPWIDEALSLGAKNPKSFATEKLNTNYRVGPRLEQIKSCASPCILLTAPGSCLVCVAAEVIPEAIQDTLRGCVGNIDSQLL